MEGDDPNRTLAKFFAYFVQRAIQALESTQALPALKSGQPGKAEADLYERVRRYCELAAMASKPPAKGKGSADTVYLERAQAILTELNKRLLEVLVLIKTADKK